MDSLTTSIANLLDKKVDLQPEIQLLLTLATQLGQIIQSEQLSATKRIKKNQKNPSNKWTQRRRTYSQSTSDSEEQTEQNSYGWDEEERFTLLQLKKSRMCSIRQIEVQLQRIKTSIAME